MSLYNENPLPDLSGRVVASATAGTTDNGYGTVRILFTDGTTLAVTEVGYAGEIEWTLTTKETNP